MVLRKFSGGETRTGALLWGLLAELAQATFQENSHERRIPDEIV
jgi:hypothetical protein